MTEAFLFQEFPKIPRLKREIVVTEKVDGTNAQIAIVEIIDEHARDAFRADPFCLAILPGAKDGDSARALYAGSRNRWLTPESDNFGFARWVVGHAEELQTLGPGRHYGEWWGAGIQRRYGQTEKRFALFNVARWNDQNPPPSIVGVVPILARGEAVDPAAVLARLGETGSIIAPGFMQPEGIIVFHSSSRQLYKMTFEMDGGKWQS
jgi:hypothetical protein